MENTTNIEQIKELLQNAIEVMIALPLGSNKENILSALALQAVLESKNKKVSIYCDSKEVENLSFLEKAQLINKQIAPENLVVSLGYTKDQIEKVGYESKDNQFNLIITPKRGRIDSSQITFMTQGINTDLVIVLGAKKLEDLGDSYLDHKEEFASDKIFNVDNHDGNEFYGAVNFVDISKTTLAEVLMPIFDVLEVDWKNQIADLLLMGIYLGTQSFQSQNINAQTFMAVSSLIGKGANLQYVVTSLYDKKNKNEEFKSDVAKDSLDNVLQAQTPPTPFMKGQEDQIQIEEPPVFQNTGEF
ncbi:hypothetical protein A2X44_02655 [candidate division CPR3 bacterium GWF2_35_18]|uniref:Phosphoesterase RecJ domain protein n=1 Tax=candidate division CPR3 bacterium GW2011_GWF2_35_18 TaxID=1618350 RepID=A0A0G0E249_UNCC3|nr:MAG: Phosphoesterase RecJ domain protein [candidate division CPR3 bacterium GW2011_GWF2_35_18]KKP87110.1 MAG: Phosphoesterase RecJ domain protein [candidate division CPR3 bacterium GW2011_GWE2_35_7]OGB62493.1 MAG: hypothetical protein A2X44_02655 [candidate division CPR3 bacterium GWF2_35_18]OGB65537.1 MAG: hypothetical protein A2250_04235 [candidate division CPR3 bacterium RIFOXYA2_FULL_35_13]OGB79428.1 MAG: hypothetical protein A2296_03370 [candidate division CPR3 bacterium RIFOXYB2_FULL_3